MANDSTALPNLGDISGSISEKPAHELGPLEKSWITATIESERSHCMHLEACDHSKQAGSYFVIRGFYFVLRFALI